MTLDPLAEQLGALRGLAGTQPQASFLIEPAPARVAVDTVDAPRLAIQIGGGAVTPPPGFTGGRQLQEQRPRPAVRRIAPLQSACRRLGVVDLVLAGPVILQALLQRLQGVHHVRRQRRPCRQRLAAGGPQA